MRQGWTSISFGVVLASCALVALPLVTTHNGIATAAAKSTANGDAKAKSSQRQFTGIVTAIDQKTLTVEKRGKKPQSRVFARHAELKTTGDLEKNARVTVYYRDEGGQSMAMRVVVKTAGSGAAERR
ncbi:MAG TPA: hypothetical protein VJY35_05670 [Candidatus Eisenbacteria bacterium]|nr:hypothetical protein [Candidatus Eisenbacteria bacterium]